MPFPPGHPDGPPAAARYPKTLSEKLGNVVGFALLGLFGLLAASGMAWLIVWLWVNLPT